MDIKDMVERMTLEEKAEICSGGDFWSTRAFERLGIPSVMMTDGPSGLRKQGGAGDHLGLNESVPAVCFPSSAAVASSFDTGLARELGEELGEECQAEDVALLLGPGLNIKRSPLCGRNFEYFSEDPVLAGEMGAALVQGMQSRGVGSCIKHFACNNQETGRMVSDSAVDERTLHEIYLAPFEAVVKKARPWAVMCAYNKVNGTYCAENRQLLTDILRDEWGFDGMVVTDWGAVKNRALGIRAGLDLEMPGGTDRGTKQIVAAIEEGSLSMDELDLAVENVLSFVDKATAGHRAVELDLERGYRLAVKAAERSAVLLKNEGGALPIAEGARVAFIGEFASSPRYQGSGSSHVNSARRSASLDCAPEGVVYAQGYRAADDEGDPALVAEAVRAAREADVAVVFAGLPDRYESEGYDRTTLAMPANQVELIDAVAAAQPRTVVVLMNGAPVTMPWAGDVTAILEMYLAGDGAGEAAVSLLYGRANPSGKLAETFPLKLEGNPSYLNFPGENDRTEYREGVFVGYRYYDAKGMEVLFPFGYGLSYTTFAYSDLELGTDAFAEGEELSVALTVTNTGERAGEEVVQLYVAPPIGQRRRPVRELKRFTKVALEPGESARVEFSLDARALSYYEPILHEFCAESGAYGIEVGASSRDIRLQGTVSFASSSAPSRAFTAYSTVGDVMAHPAGEKVFAPLLERMVQGMGEAAGSGDDAGAREMIGGIQLSSLVGFGMLTEEQLGDLLSRLNE